MIVNPGEGVGKPSAGRPKTMPCSSAISRPRFTGKILLTGSPQERELISGILSSAETRRASIFHRASCNSLRWPAERNYSWEVTPDQCTWPQQWEHRWWPFTDPRTRRETGLSITQTSPSIIMLPLITPAGSSNATYIEGFRWSPSWRPSRNASRGSMHKDYAAWASRWRVPLGFVPCRGFLFLAQPRPLRCFPAEHWRCAGLLLRAWSAGYLAKNQRLATGGPYSYTRNPLYLGSASDGIGVRNGWPLLDDGCSFRSLLCLVYWPVMKRKRQFLRRSSRGLFEPYAKQVPLFFPKMATSHPQSEKFQWRLYLKNREYEAAAGYAAGHAFSGIEDVVAIGFHGKEAVAELFWRPLGPLYDLTPRKRFH